MLWGTGTHRGWEALPRGGQCRGSRCWTRRDLQFPLWCDNGAKNCSQGGCSWASPGRATPWGDSLRHPRATRSAWLLLAPKYQQGRSCGEGEKEPTTHLHPEPPPKPSRPRRQLPSSCLCGCGGSPPGEGRIGGVLHPGLCVWGGLSALHLPPPRPAGRAPHGCVLTSGSPLNGRKEILILGKGWTRPFPPAAVVGRGPGQRHTRPRPPDITPPPCPSPQPHPEPGSGPAGGDRRVVGDLSIPPPHRTPQDLLGVLGGGSWSLPPPWASEARLALAFPVRG